MLKIKKGIKLRELKKFGFKEYEYEYIFTIDLCWEMIWVQKSNRYLHLKTLPMYNEGIFDKLLYKLYELIQAGIVEKVDE